MKDYSINTKPYLIDDSSLMIDQDGTYKPIS